jgi:hypothetical protein
MKSFAETAVFVQLLVWVAGWLRRQYKQQQTKQPCLIYYYIKRQDISPVPIDDPVKNSLTATRRFQKYLQTDAWRQQSFFVT